MNVAAVDACGLMFRLTYIDGEFVLRAESESESLHPFIESRVWEAAASLLLVREIVWSASVRFDQDKRVTKVQMLRSVLRRGKHRHRWAFRR